MSDDPVFPPDMPGLGNLHSSGGPPNDVPIRFIRKEGDKLLVTRDGKTVTHCDPDVISIKNPLNGKRTP